MAAFGHFSPAFYGITTHLAEEEHSRALAAYFEADEIGKWARGMADFDIAKLGPLSAPDHEIRHFHDALLSPWGCDMMGLRLSVVINALQSLWAIDDHPGRFLPTPMERWLDWDIAKREAWIADTGDFFGISHLDEIVTLPEIKIAAIDEFDPQEDPLPYQVWVTVDAQRKLRNARKRRPSPIEVGTISNDDAFECAAHVIQMQAIWQGQGEQATADYLQHLATANLDYLMSYRFVDHALRQAGIPITVERLSVLFAWPLLCPPLADEDHDPAMRLSCLMMTAALEPARLLADESPSELWDYLDERLDLTDWRTNLAQADASAKRRATSYAAMRASHLGEALKPVLDVADIWLDDRARLIEGFHTDPLAYVSPQRYLNDDGNWPIPAVQIRFGDRIHRRPEPVQSPTMRAITLDAEERDVAAYVWCRDHDRIDAVLDHSLFNMMVDQVFFSSDNDATADLIRSIVQNDTGKSMINVY